MPLTVLLIALRFAGVVEFIILLVAVGATLEGPFSTTILLGQEYLPGRVGLASGITYGLAIGLGGILGSALGSLAGATSIEFVIGLLPIFAALAVGLTLTLPQPAATSAVAAEDGRVTGSKNKPVRS